jgi:hypothetical protein
MFNKITGYFKYRKIINQNIDILNNRYNLRFNKFNGKLYTVLGIPERRQEVFRNYNIPSNLSNPIETDVNSYLNNEVKNYILSIEEYFYSIGLFEFISISNIDNIDEVNVLLVFRYKFKGSQRLLYWFLGLWIILFSVVFIAAFIKLIIFLFNFILAL